MKKSFTRIIKKYNVDKENIMKINTEKESMGKTPLKNMTK